jgi:hypothetical protein
MTVYQFKKRKLIDEVVQTLAEEDRDDPFEDILVITRRASGASQAYMTGMDKNNILEFIGCLEAAKIELIVGNIIEGDDDE